MNYANELCEMLGVKVNEPFRCVGVDGAWYKIERNSVSMWDAGTNQKSWCSDSVILTQLLQGILEVEKDIKVRTGDILLIDGDKYIVTRINELYYFISLDDGFVWDDGMESNLLSDIKTLFYDVEYLGKQGE